MKRKMADLDVLMDETLTLCKTPPVPRRHPYRQFYQYRKPQTVDTPAPEKPDVDMTDLAAPPMFTFGSQPDLVPKPLFSRSNSMPSRSNSLPSRSSRPVRPPEPFQFNSDIVKSPSPLFSRRNTLPPRVRRATTSERRPSPLSHREDAEPSEEPTHAVVAMAPPTSPPKERPTLITIPPSTKKTPATPSKTTPHKTTPHKPKTTPHKITPSKTTPQKTIPPKTTPHNTIPPQTATPAKTTPAIPPHPTRPAPPIPSMATPSKPGPSKATPAKATPSRSSSVTASTPKRPSPLSGKGSARRPGPSHIAPFQPASPMVLSPVTSHTSSVTSSPTPSVFSDVASFSASAPSTPSTPSTSPPSSPATRARSPMCYFSPAYWTIATSPSPVYIPRQKLRRKDSPRFDSLRTLRAKESDACLERIYDQRTSAYMEWTGFQALTN